MKNLKFQFVLLVLFLLSIQSVLAQQKQIPPQIIITNSVTVTISQYYKGGSVECVHITVEGDMSEFEKFTVFDNNGNTLECTWREEEPCEATWCYDKVPCGTPQKEERINCSMTIDGETTLLAEGSTVIIEPRPCHDIPGNFGG